MTVGVQAGVSTTVTVITIPTGADGRNVKVRVWGSGVTNGVAIGAGGGVLSQIIEQTFFRDAGATTAMTAHINNAQVNGTFTGTVGLAIVAGNIAVQVTGDSTTASNFSLMVEWQDGGLAS